MFISIKIRGEKLDPATVTKVMKIPPSQSFKKGDSCGYQNPKFAKKHRNFGFWMYSSADAIKCSDPIMHLRHIVQILALQETDIRNIDGVHSAEVEIYIQQIVSESRSCIGEVLIEYSALTAIKNKGLDLKFSYDAFVESQF